MITLQELEGLWRLSRVIEDARAGLTGGLEGQSLWSRGEGGLIQTETGMLHYGNAAPMQATRRYLWRGEGGALQVFFDDGRPFHEVPQDGGEALHDCPPDTYRVTYRFGGPEAFTTRWHVTGPRKDAVITSTFTRA